MTDINFHDIDASLINEFCGLVTDTDIKAAVDFAVKHSTEPWPHLDITSLAMKVAADIQEGLYDGDYDLLDEQMSALEDALVRSAGEIREAETQAYERAWALRAAQHADPISTGPWVEITMKYPDLLKPENQGPWVSGYYSGIMAALRWAQGAGWNADT